MRKKATKAATPAPPAWPSWAGLVVAVLLAYIPVWRAGFIWDDALLVTDNPLVSQPGGLRAIWFSMAATDYTPLTLTFFRLQYLAWGACPLGYHLVGILLHAGAVLLAWRILRLLEIPGAWLGALFFAVHPVNVASVAWVAEQKNTLSLVFFLTAVLCYLQPARDRLAYGGALAAAACAFASKGSAVVLPLVLLVCEWVRRGRLRRGDLVAVIPFFALAAAAAAVTILFQFKYGEVTSMHDPPAFRIVRAADAIWFYLGKSLWPAGLCAVYPKWEIDPAHWLAWLPVLLLVALPVVLWRLGRPWARAMLMGLVYFVLCLLPVLGFVNMGYMDQAYVADWWMEIALLGVAALGGAAFSRIRAPIARVPLAAGAALSLAVLTWSQASGYESMEVFSRRVLERNPGSWSAHTNLAFVLTARGRTGEAIEHLRASLRLKPDSQESYNDLGNAYEQQGENALALPLYRRAVELNPGDPTAHCNLGKALQGAGQLEAAEAEEATSARLSPTFVEARYNHANILKAMHRWAEAAAEYRATIRLRPAAPEAHNNLANVLVAMQDHAGAIPEYREAIRLQPGDAVAWFNLGFALDALGRRDEALGAYAKATEINPGAVAAQWNLATLLVKAGRAPEAVAHFGAVIDLKPDDADALAQASTLLCGAGRCRDAAGLYERALALKPGGPALQNGLAWLLATCPDAAVRDGPRALDLAGQLARAVGPANPILLNTQAAALAETGRYPEALAAARAALPLAAGDEDLAAQLRRAIDLYRSGQPMRIP